MPARHGCSTLNSIWRQGDDINLYGPGTPVQQWMTYRDAETWRSIVRRGHYSHFNSLMYRGGIVSAENAYYGLEKVQSDGDFADQVWSYFATGTQLQELYITPSMLNKAKWDVLAEAAKWSRENAHVLVDTHWVGGDPTAFECMAGPPEAKTRRYWDCVTLPIKPAKLPPESEKSLKFLQGEANPVYSDHFAASNSPTVPEHYQTPWLLRYSRCKRCWFLKPRRSIR